MELSEHRAVTEQEIQNLRILAAEAKAEADDWAKWGGPYMAWWFYSQANKYTLMADKAETFLGQDFDFAWLWGEFAEGIEKAWQAANPRPAKGWLDRVSWLTPAALRWSLIGAAFAVPGGMLGLVWLFKWRKE